MQPSVGVVGARSKNAPASVGQMSPLSPPTPTSTSVGPEEPHFEETTAGAGAIGAVKAGVPGAVEDGVPKAGAPAPPTGWKDVEQYGLEQMLDTLERFRKHLEEREGDVREYKRCTKCIRPSVGGGERGPHEEA